VAVVEEVVEEEVDRSVEVILLVDWESRSSWQKDCRRTP
jgi:hypothetical protein